VTAEAGQLTGGVERSMFERRLHALAAGLVLLCIALVLTTIVFLDRTDSLLQAADDRWWARMIELRTPWLTRVAKVMSFLGGPVVMLPLRVAVVAALAWQRRWLQFGAFLGAVVSSELCIGPLKALIDRPRPPDPMIATHSASFPSGHAIAASVTAIGLVVVLVPAAARRTRWTIVASAFAVVVAMSRTYLGAHWASDVIAGACIGTGLAVVWAASLELERGRRRSATPSSGPGHAGRPEGQVMGTISVVLLGVGLACVVALHVLRPDLTPAGHRLSEYAIGSYGAMMTVAFVSIGAGLLALASPLARAGGRCSRVVPAAVFAAGTGMVVAGIYRTDPSHSGVTADAVHSRASAFATLALIGAALAWSVVRARRWDITTSLALLAAVLGAVSPFLHRSQWTGLSQRMLWLTLLAWLIVIASRLAPRSRQQLGDPSARVRSG